MGGDVSGIAQWLQSRPDRAPADAIPPRQFQLAGKLRRELPGEDVFKELGTDAFPQRGALGTPRGLRTGRRLGVLVIDHAASVPGLVLNCRKAPGHTTLLHRRHLTPSPSRLMQHCAPVGDSRTGKNPSAHRLRHRCGRERLPDQIHRPSPPGSSINSSKPAERRRFRRYLSPAHRLGMARTGCQLRPGSSALSVRSLLRRDRAVRQSFGRAFKAVFRPVSGG